MKKTVRESENKFLPEKTNIAAMINKSPEMRVRAINNLQYSPDIPPNSNKNNTLVFYVLRLLLLIPIAFLAAMYHLPVIRFPKNSRGHSFFFFLSFFLFFPFFCFFIVTIVTQQFPNGRPIVPNNIFSKRKKKDPFQYYSYQERIVLTRTFPRSTPHPPRGAYWIFFLNS